MELLPVVLTSGWASGINAYLVVLVLGLIGRFSEVAGIPEGLTRTDVLVVAATLYLVELVADKIPYFDSLWDAVSTAIRPTVGAVIGLLIAQDAPTLEQAVLAASGGAAALVSHLVKGGLRLIVNTSPEPASNIAVSVGEDVAVAGVTTLAVLNPVLAFTIAALLLGIGILLLVLLWSRVLRGWRRLRAWRARRAAALVPQPKNTSASAYSAGSTDLELARRLRQRHADDVGAAQRDHLPRSRRRAPRRWRAGRSGWRASGRRRSACRRAARARARWCAPPCRCAPRSPWPASRRCRRAGRARTRRASRP